MRTTSRGRILSAPALTLATNESEQDAELFPAAAFAELRVGELLLKFSTSLAAFVARP
jgi:hypothetical protein